MKEKPIHRNTLRRGTHTENAKGRKVRAIKKKLIAPVQINEFIERISDGFVAFDTQMNYTYVNQRGGELLGRKPEDLIGKNYWEEFPEARGTPFANAYVRALETQSPILFEDYYVPWNRWFENRIFPSNNGITILFSEITERKLAEEQIQRQIRHLNALRMIDIAIGSSFDLNLVLNLVLQYILSQLGVDAGAVLLFQPHMQSVEYIASRGFQSTGMPRARSKLSEGLANHVVTKRQTIHLTDAMQTDEKLAQQSLQLANEGFVDYYGAPLIVKGEVKGVLEVYHRTPMDFDSEQLEFFETLAGQTAIAIDNAQLFNNLQTANRDLILAYDATIAGWSQAMDLRDKKMQGHTQRVADLTLSLARVMKISDSQLIHIRRGALLHDIGKIGVPDHILLKPERLTDEEQLVMNKHPEYAYELLSPIQYLQPALDIPFCHHEHWDGTGYPRGLKGEEIPFAARIFSVVDVWDTLVSDRPYRQALGRAQAIEFIREQSGKQFDPQVVEAFLQLIR